MLVELPLGRTLEARCIDQAVNSSTPGNFKIYFYYFLIRLLMNSNIDRTEDTTLSHEAAQSLHREAEASLDSQPAAATVQEAFTQSGGFGRYQCLLLLTLILGNNGTGLIVYGATFFELDPPYLCVYNEPPLNPSENVMMDSNTFTYTVPCDQETICDTKRDKTLIGYTIDKSSIFYIQNWIEQMNIACTPRGYIGAIGSFTFLGSGLACLFLPTLGDKYGRFAVWRATIFFTLPVILLLNLSNHLGAIYVANFFLGINVIGRFTIGFVLASESVSKQHQAYMGITYQNGDMVATFYVLFLLRYITNDGSVLIWLGFALTLLAFILSFWLVESPTWLASLGHELEAAKKFAYIAKVNGAGPLQFEVVKADEFGGESETTQDDDIRASDAANVRQDEAVDRFDLKQNIQEESAGAENKVGLCSNRSIIINLLLMTVFWTTSSLNYYIVLYYLKYVPGNIYVNAALSCTADIASHLILGGLMKKLGVRISFMIAFGLAASGSCLLVIFFKADGALIAVFVMLAKFGIGMAFGLSYLSMPGLFPPEVLTTAFGICNLFARFSSVLSSEIAELPDPAPMSIYTITCVVALFLSPYLRRVQKVA